MFEGNEDVKVMITSLVEFLWVEVVTKVGPCYGMSDGRDVGKLEGLGEIYYRSMRDM